MEGRVGLAARKYGEICWYDLHEESNPGRLYGSTIVYPLKWLEETKTNVEIFISRKIFNLMFLCKPLLFSGNTWFSNLDKNLNVTLIDIHLHKTIRWEISELNINQTLT